MKDLMESTYESIFVNDKILDQLAPLRKVEDKVRYTV